MGVGVAFGSGVEVGAWVGSGVTVTGTSTILGHLPGDLNLVTSRGRLLRHLTVWMTGVTAALRATPQALRPARSSRQA